MLGSKGNLKVMTFLLKSLVQVALIYMLANPNICTECIVGVPKHIQCVSGRRSEKLRMMFGNEILISAIVADNLNPRCIWLESVGQFSSKSHCAQKAIYKIEYHAMR